jgi:hypothetical protein
MSDRAASVIPRETESPSELHDLHEYFTKYKVVIELNRVTRN